MAENKKLLNATEKVKEYTNLFITPIFPIELPKNIETVLKDLLSDEKVKEGFRKHVDEYIGAQVTEIEELGLIVYDKNTGGNRLYDLTSAIIRTKFSEIPEVQPKVVFIKTTFSFWRGNKD